MCEALLNRALAEKGDTGVKVISAGLNATPGKVAHPWAITAAEEIGISLQHHQARLLTREMVERADAILTMDHQNKAQLLSRFPEARNKVFMLSAYGGDSYEEVEIRDPYYMGLQGTRDCYRVLQACVNNLADCIAQKKP
jgi:protein-tyrosine phosphatase